VLPLNIAYFIDKSNIFPGKRPVSAAVIDRSFFYRYDDREFLDIFFGEHRGGDMKKILFLAGAVFLLCYPHLVRAEIKKGSYELNPFMGYCIGATLPFDKASLTEVSLPIA
jgi:hypothetical protein